MSHRAGNAFRTKFYVARRTLVVDLERPRRILSSAPKGGGVVRARYVLNHQVPANPVTAPQAGRHWEYPARYLGQVAAQLGIDGESVGLMTAVDLRQLVNMREEEAGVWVEGFLTVGVSNAVRAGEPFRARRPKQARPTVGTINLILITNARLATSALVTAVQVATESKTAVLLSEGIPSWTGLPGATGTGTDTVVVVGGAPGDGPAVRYSGTHTAIGAMIGRLVGRGVREGLARWARATRQGGSGSP